MILHITYYIVFILIVKNTSARSLICYLL